MIATTDKTTSVYERDDAAIEALARPVDPGDIKYRQATYDINTTVKMLGYVDARYVMDRLDESVGSANWTNEYMEIKGRIFCRITINFPSGKTISKMDCGSETTFEQEKGVVSDALKRAAVLFGIGRDLYSLPDYKAETNARGKVSYGWLPPSLPQPHAVQTDSGNKASTNRPSDPEPPPIAFEPTPIQPPLSLIHI